MGGANADEAWVKEPGSGWRDALEQLCAQRGAKRCIRAGRLKAKGKDQGGGAEG